jgi:hypothetical protein
MSDVASKQGQYGRRRQRTCTETLILGQGDMHVNRRKRLDVTDVPARCAPHLLRQAQNGDLKVNRFVDKKTPEGTVPWTSQVSISTPSPEEPQDAWPKRDY